MAAPAPATSVTSAAPAVPAASAPLADRLLAWTDCRRRWLFAGLVLVYLAGFNPQWRLEPDSALYLTIGRNLVNGKGYTFHGRSYHMAYPGLPMLFAGLFRMIPTRSLLPAQMMTTVLGLATLALVYRLFLLRAGRPTAVMVTLGLGMTRLFYRYCFELLTDLPFLLGVVMFLAGYEAVFHARERGKERHGDTETRRQGEESQPPCSVSPCLLVSVSPCLPLSGGPGLQHAPRWFDWVFLLAGLVIAVATRPAMWALVFAAVAAAVWSLARGRGGSMRWGQVLIGLAVVAAVALFYFHDPRNVAPPGTPSGPVYAEEDQMFQFGRGRLVEMARRAAHNVLPVFGRQATKAVFGMPLTVPLGLVLDFTVIGLGVALVRTRPLWGMFVLTTVGMVLLVPKPQERYLLPVLPLLVFAWWGFIRRLNHRLTDRIGSRRADWVFVVLFVIGAVPNGAQLFGFIREQRAAPFLAHYKEGRYASVYEVADMVTRYTPPSGSPDAPDTAWVFVPEKFGRILTYLSGRYATEADESTRLNPWVNQSWLYVYVLEPTDPDKRDPSDRRPTTHEWLKSRGFEVMPEVIATVPNKDPDAREPWTLHRIRPIGMSRMDVEDAGRRVRFSGRGGPELIAAGGTGILACGETDIPVCSSPRSEDVRDSEPPGAAAP